MSTTTFENAKLVSGLSKITSVKVFLDKSHKHSCNLNYIEIPDFVALKFDLKEGDSLIWHYYVDKKAAIVVKREGWKSREARCQEKVFLTLDSPFTLTIVTISPVLWPLQKDLHISKALIEKALF